MLLTNISGKIKKYFGDRAFWRTTAALALPIALQNLLTSSFVLVDTLMVGQLGDVALSAVGMAGQVSWFWQMILFGLCSGMAVLVSQYWGAGEEKSIRRIYGIALTSALALSLLFAIPAFFAPETIMSIFNRDPAVVAIGASYLRIAALSYPAVALSTVCSTLLRSVERVHLPVIVSVFTTAANAFFNYGLIFGAFGLPRLEVEGAAIATCISSWLGPILLYAISAFRRNILVGSPREIFGFSRASVAEYFKKATPVILNETMWGLGTLIVNVIFANKGHEEYAAVTIFRTFENIAFVFFVGLCNACCVMVGKSVGSGKTEQAVTDARRFSLLVPLMGTAVGTAIIIFREQLVSVFNMQGNITENTFGIACTLMLIYALELTVRNIPYIQIVGIFRSGGDTSTGTKYDVIGLWLLSIPCTAAAAYLTDLPFTAIFAIMYIAEDYVKSLLCIRYFRTGKWIRPVTPEGREGLRLFRESEALRHSEKAKNKIGKTKGSAK